MRIYNWRKYLSAKQYESIVNMHDMDSIVVFLKTLGFKETDYVSTEGLGRFIRQSMVKKGFNDWNVSVEWHSSSCEITVRFT